jgi:hypothetical protein
MRRNAYAEVVKLTAGFISAPFHSSNFEESVLDSSGGPPKGDAAILGYLAPILAADLAQLKFVSSDH